MKKLYALSLILFLVNQSHAQCPVNDSTLMGAGTTSDVFYSFANHTVKTVPNTNWHLAFSVQQSNFPNNPANGVAIRVNSGGNGTILRKLNNADPTQWRSIDTTGLYLLPVLYDSDSTWNLSAFTKGYAYPSFNFVWGSYNNTTHNVDGSSVFILSNSAAGWHKKVYVKSMVFDTMWQVIISNVDNTDSNYLQIRKAQYPNKLFTYYNATTHQMIDREPTKTNWDLLWTKYVTWVTSQMGSGWYPVSGVLSNPKVTVEQNYGKKCNEVWLRSKTSKVDPSISAIGYDWKTFNGTSYDITDTFVYFVVGQDNKTYKMTFKGYSGGSLGKSTFNFYEATLGVDQIEAQNKVQVYPNPGTDIVKILAENQIDRVMLVDMQGKVVAGAVDSVINVSGLASGIYTIVVYTADGVYRQPFVKQ